MSDWRETLLGPQRLAATMVGREIVVTAGAGTGKTHTLTSRTLHLLEAVPQSSIDRFLIVTFTRNAASEMRERIAKELEKRLWDHPGESRWRTQRIAMHHAAIATLDSFCWEIVRTYIHATDLDPACVLLDEDDAEFLEAECLKATFETLYGEDSPLGESFRRLALQLGGRGYDGELYEQVRKLFSLMQVQNRPRAWLETVRSIVGTIHHWRGDPANIWRRTIETTLTRELVHLESDTYRALHWIEYLGAEETYLDKLITILQTVQNILRSNQPLAESIPYYFFEIDKLPPAWGKNQLDDVQSALLEPLVERVAARFTKIKNNFAPLLDPRFDAWLSDNAIFSLMLLDVTERHADTYREAKAKERVVDFNDIEQTAHQLLENAPGVRDRLRDQYDYLLIDEVQDINRLQYDIIHQLAAENRSNLFWVGDVKQSIYGFRLAEPQLLLDKIELAAQERSPHRIERIDLQHNFRSRPRLIEAVNALFSRIMHAQFGGLSYDERAFLLPKADLYPDAGPQVEFVILDKSANAEHDEEETDTGRSGEENAGGEAQGPLAAIDSFLAYRDDAEREAAVVVHILKTLLYGEDGGPVSIFDKESRAMRPLRMRDIAILMRSPRSTGEIYIHHIEEAGIPVYADFGGGFFDRPEVRDLISWLQTIENPRQDVPLASYLTSVAGGATYSDLVRARRAFPGGALLDSVRKTIKNGTDPAVQERLRAAITRLKSWRQAAARMPLPDLIRMLLHSTGYLVYVSCQSYGMQRRTNVLEIAKRARTFCNFQNQGLARFLRYLEHLREKEESIVSPSPLSDREEIVRLMSVHASKGLEFPVVILPQLSHRFNLQDAYRNLVLDDELGPVLKHFDTETGITAPSLIQFAASRKRRHRNLVEELRIWYVALTRARERLYMIGTTNWKKQPFQWYGGIDPKTGNVAVSYLERCQTPLDWFAPAAIQAGARIEGIDGEPLLPVDPNSPIEMAKVSDELLLQWAQEDATSLSANAEKAGVEADPLESVDQSMDEIVRRLTWTYPFAAVTSLSAKATVTDLKQVLHPLGEEGEFAHPEFLKPQPIRSLAQIQSDRDAVRRGTVTHRFFELIDFTQADTHEAIVSQLQGLVHRGVLSEEEAALIDLDAVHWFTQTDLGRALANPALQVEHECAFTLAARAGEIQRDLQGEMADELVHIQGAIDLLCIADAVTVVDFKTDRIPAEQIESYAERYFVQLQLYARAAQAILNKPVDKALLVFLSPRMIVEVPSLPIG